MRRGRWASPRRKLKIQSINFIDVFLLHLECVFCLNFSQLRKYFPGNGSDFSSVLVDCFTRLMKKKDLMRLVRRWHKDKSDRLFCLF